jgi:hypothetical protein
MGLSPIGPLSGLWSREGYDPSVYLGLFREPESTQPLRQMNETFDRLYTTLDSSGKLWDLLTVVYSNSAPQIFDVMLSRLKSRLWRVGHASPHSAVASSESAIHSLPPR